MASLSQLHLQHWPLLFVYQHHKWTSWRNFYFAADCFLARPMAKAGTKLGYFTRKSLKTGISTKQLVASLSWIGCHAGNGESVRLDEIKLVLTNVADDRQLVLPNVISPTQEQSSLAMWPREDEQITTRISVCFLTWSMLRLSLTLLFPPSIQ